MEMGFPSRPRTTTYDRQRMRAQRMSLSIISEAEVPAAVRATTDGGAKMLAHATVKPRRRDTVQQTHDLRDMQSELYAIGAGSGSSSGRRMSAAQLKQRRSSALVAAAGGDHRRGTLRDVQTLGRMQSDLRSIGNGLPPARDLHTGKRRGTHRDIDTLGRMQSELRNIGSGLPASSSAYASVTYASDSAPPSRRRLSTRSAQSEIARIHADLHGHPRRRSSVVPPKPAAVAAEPAAAETDPRARPRNSKSTQARVAKQLRRMSEPPNTVSQDLFVAARKSGAIVLVTPRNRRELHLRRGSPVVWKDNALGSWVSTRCASKPDSEWFVKVNVLGQGDGVSLWTKCGHFGNQLFAIRRK